MVYSEVLTYIHNILSLIPLSHWLVCAVMSLAIEVFILIRHKNSVYSALVLCMTLFVGFLLLEAAVAIRYYGIMSHTSGSILSLDLKRLRSESVYYRSEVFSNIAVFSPFGFFLSEYLAEIKRNGVWRRIGCSALAAFLLSLLIEFLQIFLHVGFFDVTDLVMNTVGGLTGACMASLLRFAINGYRQKHT